MDFIKSWTFSVCATLLLASVLSLVSPRGGMGRFYKIVISLFVFFRFCFRSPSLTQQILKRILILKVNIKAML